MTRMALESDKRIVPMRVQKFLARAGVASRRGSEDLMTAGRVRVNGIVVSELGSKVDPLVDTVTVDNIPISLNHEHTYLVLYKPQGFITTMSDPKNRPTVRELVPYKDHPGLFPVGRLDKDTTGILLFMTDGELAAKLLHPSSEVKKTYRARVDGIVRNQELDPLKEGITLDDGPCAPAQVSLLNINREQETSEVEITLHEGRKHQVKRMLSHIGHPVLDLTRISFGPITTQGLAVGDVRKLTKGELEKLQSSVLPKENGQA